MTVLAFILNAKSHLILFDEKNRWLSASLFLLSNLLGYLSTRQFEKGGVV